MDTNKCNLRFISLLIIFSSILFWSPASVMAQGGRWQIQFDREANDALGLEGNTLRGSFATLKECEVYRKSLSEYEQSHTKSVRSDVAEGADIQALPKPPSASQPAPPVATPPKPVIPSYPASPSDVTVDSDVAGSTGVKEESNSNISDEPDQSTVDLQPTADVPEIVVQLGHLKQVNAVALTPDGSFAVTGGSDGMLKLWDAGSGKEIRNFKGIHREITSIAISGDGQFAVTGSNEHFGNNVQLWNISTGNLVKNYLGFSDMVTSVAISPDGQFVVAGSSEEFKVWRTQTGEEIHIVKGHTGYIQSVIISTDGQYIITGSQDKTIKVWDLNSGKIVRTISGQTDEISSLAGSPDGKFIISGSFNDSPRMWDMNTGYMMKTFDRGGVLSVAISPDGKYVLFGGEPDIEVWDITKGKKIKTLKGGEPGWVRSLAWSRDGKSILSGGDDKCVKLWNSDSGEQIWSSKGHSQVVSAAINADGGKLIVGMSSGLLHIWDLFTGKQIQTIKHSVGVNCVSINSGGTKLFAGGWDFKERRTCAKQWDSSTGKEFAEFHQDGGSWVNSLAITGDGNNLLWSVNADLILSDISTGQKIRSFNSTGQVEIKGINTRGKYAISSDGIGVSQLWNIETGEAIHAFNGYYATLSHNNNKVLLLGQDAEDQITLKQWDINTKQETASTSVHYPMKIKIGQDSYRYKQIYSLDISPDDKFALWSCDNELHLWNIADAKEINCFSNHTGLINSIGFSPNGEYAFSGSLDGSVRLWNLETGKEMARLYSFNDGEWLTITPGGYFEASPNGANYLAVREDNYMSEISRVQHTLQDPVIIQSVLIGDTPPTDLTLASVLAMNYTPASASNIGFGLIEILLLLILIWIIPFLAALTDILRNNFEGNNKIVWVLILLLIPIIGSILYFVIGRKQKINNQST